MDTIKKIFGTGNFTGEAAEGLQTLAIIAAVLLLILAISIFSAIENSRFRGWYKRNSMLDTPLSPWRTLVPWHRVGSKWFNDRAGDLGAKPSFRNAHADINRLYDDVGKTLKVKISNHRYK